MHVIRTSVSPLPGVDLIRTFLCGVLLLCGFIVSNPGHAAPLAFLTNQQSHDVSILDTATGEVVKTLKVGDQPAGISVSATSSYAYVTNPGDKSVSIINTQSLEVTNSVTIGDGPLAIVVDDKRARVYVADWYLNYVSILEAETLKSISTVAVGKSPSGLVISPDSSTLYVSNRDDHSVSAIDLESLAVTGSVTTGERPFGMTIDSKGKRLYSANVHSNSISVIDTETLVVLKNIPVGDRPYHVALARQDSLAFVTDQYDNTVTVIDTATLENIKQIDVGEYPEGIDTHPDDRHVYVANWFDNTVSIIDSHTLEVVNTVDTGDGTRAYGNFFTAADASETNHSLLVLDFELNDLTMHPAVEMEEKRVKTLRPLLTEDLQETHHYPIASLPEEQRKAEQRGKGYIFDRPAVAARLGKAANARWVVTGRLHKASFLFVYLKSQLIDTHTGAIAADFVVEIKGWEPRLTAKGVEALAVEIDEALTTLTAR